ncbi:hypothetical protein QCA50_009131 [Cerrena zonata]|uniref:Uncharacterized protein n=1 Tax=Cerrena zonata TaxID=2478898 RepID=A0AAW0GDA4_9APHY
MSRIPPPPPPPADPPKESSPSPSEPLANDLSEKAATTNTSPGVGEKPQDASKPPNAFLNNMGGAMGNMVDVRKWNWPGYLTFGKSGSPSKTAGTHTPSTLSSALKPEPEETPSASLSNAQESTSEGLLQVKHGEIDTESLHEAINSEHVHSPQPSQHQLSPSTQSPSVPATPARSVSPSLAVESEAPSKSTVDTDLTQGENVSDGDDDQAEGSESESESDSHSSSVESEKPSPPEEPIPSFNVTSIHLSDGDDIYATSRKRVLHLTKHPLTIAIIVEADHDPNDTSLAKACLETLQKLQDAISEEESKNLEASLPTVHKILERQDRFVISTEDYTTTSLQGFDSRSEHLFNGQAILRSDHDVQEVFSRGQNPQHWHIARRGLGTDREGKSTEGEVYMEIARKESTLTDVDNELAGVVRKFLE